MRVSTPVGTEIVRQSFTDSYITEILRAMLEEMLAMSKVYITQIRIVYMNVEEILEGTELYKNEDRWKQWVEVIATFTSSDLPCMPSGSSGRDPKVRATFLLASKGPKYSFYEIRFAWGSHQLIFDKSFAFKFSSYETNEGNHYAPASDKLEHLVELLKSKKPRSPLDNFSI
jgi:hypothetical protein